MEAKTPKDSMVEMRELVLPNDANLLGNLLGGRLMHWVDIAGAMAAQRHCNRITVTASIDSVDFKHPVHLGEMIILKAKVTWVGRTSMEVAVEAFSEDYMTGKTRFTNKAYLTFVAINEDCKPSPVPALIPETEDEKKEFELAIKRREERLARKELNG